ncbi:MAG: DUF167 domain-containing protein [Acidimicrobiia bacterium]|nr:DUF167 domain-containing protein [Acidimicrobiia bacterium]
MFSADGEDAVLLAVHAQPGAGRTQVAGRHGDALKVRVAAPPEGGRANTELARLLAETFAVKPAAVTLTAGDTSRTKRFRIAGVAPADFGPLLEQVLAGGPVPTGRTAPVPGRRP